GPVAVERGNRVFRQARDRELRFLVPHSVLTVVDARDDPEQLGLELVVERAGGTGLAGAAAEAASPSSVGQVERAQAALVVRLAVAELCLLLLRQFGKRDARLARLHV